MADAEAVDRGKGEGDKENVAAQKQARHAAHGPGEDKATQTPAKLGRAGSMDKDSWKDWDKGRATFRPPASEVGRPVFHPDAEEAEVQLRTLKQDLRRADAERDLAKAHLVRAEKEIKRRDHRLFKELEEHQGASMLPARLGALVKECLKSGAAEEVRMLREKVAALEAAGEGMRNAGFAGTPGPSGGAPGTPRAKLAARFEDDAPASPMRRQASSLSKGGSARSLMATGGGEALQAARAEIEQLKKLCAAHDVIREGLEKRVAQLEAQLQRQNAAPSGAAAASVPGPGGAAPLAAGAMASDGERKEPTPSLFTDDGRDFDNYIRRLAGLSELEAPKDARDKQHVAVRVGTDAKSKRRPAVHTQGQKGEKEVVYEVTCYTSDVPGAGTTSNCYITLRGQGGEFGPCALERADAHSAVPGVGVLAQKATDVFDIVAVNVEPLHSIIISHDMSGSAPSWHLRTMTLRRHRSSSAEAKTYRFEWDNWVGPPQGSPATSPPSITLFPEMVNKDSGDPGHSGLQARPRTAPGAAGRAHGASGAGAAAAGARGEGRLTLHPAALSDACKSMVSAIRELHLPSTVSHDSGLQRLARLLGMGGASAAGGSRIEVPAGSRNLSVAFFGPRHVCTELVEWYGGCKMSDTGLSTKARFTLVKALPSGHHASGAGTYLLGQDGKGELGHFAGLADEVPALLSSLAVAQVPTGNMRMAQVDLVHPPVIEGPPPASAPSSFLEVGPCARACSTRCGAARHSALRPAPSRPHRPR